MTPENCVRTMHFLITNDDGFDAPGLAALYRALSELGHVTVVAPSQCHSAKGHAVNTHVPIRVAHRDVEPFGRIDIVDGSPADCVRVGLTGLNHQRPDFVIAGINPGANLGVDLFYSGTAAAAREAAIMGVPAIAVSRYVRAEVAIGWEQLVPHVTRAVARLTHADHVLPAGQFWNLNFPAVPESDYPPDVTIAPQGVQSHEIIFEPIESSEDETLLQYQGVYSNRGQSGACDVSHVFSDRIVATPVDLCNTAVHRDLRST